MYYNFCYVCVICISQFYNCKTKYFFFIFENVFVLFFLSKSVTNLVSGLRRDFINFLFVCSVTNVHKSIVPIVSTFGPQSSSITKYFFFLIFHFLFWKTIFINFIYYSPINLSKVYEDLVECNNIIDFINPRSLFHYIWKYFYLIFLIIFSWFSG